MIIEELLDEEAFDPKKLFNEEEYSTLIIDREGFSKKQNETANIIEQLLDKEITRAEAEEIFSKLKDQKATRMLLGSVSTAKSMADKVTLVAACWETGLDFSADLNFFVELVCQPTFELAVEALSVVENLENISPEGAAAALVIVNKSKEGSQELRKALEQFLNDIINA